MTDAVRERDMIDKLGRHIRKQDMSSAEACLNEIRQFRAEQVNRLLAQHRDTPCDLEFDPTCKQNIQPEGSLEDVLRIALQALHRAHREDDEELRQYGVGLLEWIRLQIQYVIPAGERLMVTNRLNSVLRNIRRGEQLFRYDQALDEFGIGLGFDFDVDQLIQTVEETEILPYEATGSEQPQSSLDSVTKAEEAFNNELLESMMDVHQTAAVGLKHAKDQLGEDQIIDIYRDYLARTAFSERQANSPRFGVPLPPYPSLVLGEDAAVSPLLVNFPQGLKTAGLFLLDWVENILAALQETIPPEEQLFTTGLHNALRPADRTTLILDSNGVVVRANAQPKHVEISGALPTENAQRQAEVATAFAMAWLADGSGSDITIVNKDTGEEDVKPKAASVMAMRDYLRDDLSLKLRQKSKACADLAALLQLASGQSASVLKEDLEAIQNASNVRIIRFAERASNNVADHAQLDFKTLCQRCTARSGNGCNNESFSMMQRFHKNGFDGDLERFQQFADLLRPFDPNCQDELKAFQVKGSNQVYDFRAGESNAELLVAISDRYMVNDENNRIEVSLEPYMVTRTLQIPTGEYEGSLLASKLQDSLNESFRESGEQFSVAWKPFGEQCPFYKFVIQLPNDTRGFKLSFSEAAARLWGFLPGETISNMCHSSDLYPTMLERTQSFILAARGDISFPERDAISLDCVSSSSGDLLDEKRIDSIELADSIVIRTFSKPQTPGARRLTSVLILEVLAGAKREGSLFTKADYILLDLPKAVLVAEFKEEGQDATCWRAVDVNSALDFMEMSNGLKFHRAFPRTLRKQPVGMAERSDIDSLVGTDIPLEKEEFFYRLDAPDDFKMHHRGPWAVNGDELTGLMVRRIPSDREMLEFAQRILREVGPASKEIINLV